LPSTEVSWKSGAAEPIAGLSASAMPAAGERSEKV
jgi:hypothetical protein